MAVAFDAVASSTGFTSATATISFTHTAGTGGSVAVVAVAYSAGSWGPPTVSSATYGGNAMTTLGSQASDNSTQGGVFLFGITGQSSGANTVSVTFGAAPSDKLIGNAMSFTGAGSFGTAVTAFGNSANPSVTVTSVASTSVVAATECHGSLSVSPPIPYSPGTERFDDEVANTTGAGNLSGGTNTGSGSVTLTTTVPTDFWGMIGVEVIASAAAGVTWTPQRYGQAAPPSPAPWAQRDRRDANTTGTAANPLVPPLDTAWQADAGYWHLYGDSALRDRRAYFQQRSLVSDPNLLSAVNADPLALNPEQSNSSDLWRVAAVPAFYDRRLVPQQRAYYGPPVTALLENELLGGADTARHGQAAFYDRREVPQQRAYISDPLLLTTAELENELLGGAQTWMHYVTAAYYDRREVPQQRLYISDPSTYPTGTVTDPLTVAWGAGGPYWHLYNRAPDLTDRREYPAQRLYQSDPLLLTTAELENELLGGAETGKYYRVPATHAPRWWMPQQPARLADPLLLTTALLENELLGGADVMRHYLAAAYTDRREVPQQRAYISDPSFYPTGAVTDPLTVAWGAGGPYWHLYNRAADATDRREVPQQRPYVSDPLLLTTALLENELLGGAGTGQRYGFAAYYDRREVPQQRGPVVLVTPPVPFDPLLAAWADLARRYGLAATHADRRLYPQQRLYFPVPLPPPPFTIGALTASDAALAVLTAIAAAGGGGGVLTATDQRTGGPS